MVSVHDLEAKRYGREFLMAARHVETVETQALRPFFRERLMQLGVHIDSPSSHKSNRARHATLPTSRALRILNAINEKNQDELIREFLSINVNFSGQQNISDVVQLIFEKAFEKPESCHHYANICKAQTDSDLFHYIHYRKYARFGLEVIERAEKTFRRCIRPPAFSDFLAHLYRNHLLDTRLVHGFVYCSLCSIRPGEELLRKLPLRREDIREDDVEFGLRLIEKAGPFLDTFEDSSTDFLNEWFENLEAAMPFLSEKIRFNVMDVAELRNNRWRPFVTSHGHGVLAQLMTGCLESEHKEPPQVDIMAKLMPSPALSNSNTSESEAERHDEDELCASVRSLMENFAKPAGNGHVTTAKLGQKVLELLDKIDESNQEEVSREFLSLNVSLNENELREAVDVIFMRVMEQSTNGSLYAELFKGAPPAFRQSLSEGLQKKFERVVEAARMTDRTELRASRNDHLAMIKFAAHLDRHQIIPTAFTTTFIDELYPLIGLKPTNAKVELAGIDLEKIACLLEVHEIRGEPTSSNVAKSQESFRSDTPSSTTPIPEATDPSDSGTETNSVLENYSVTASPSSESVRRLAVRMHGASAFPAINTDSETDELVETYKKVFSSEKQLDEYAQSVLDTTGASEGEIKSAVANCHLLTLAEEQDTGKGSRLAARIVEKTRAMFQAKFDDGSESESRVMFEKKKIGLMTLIGALYLVDYPSITTARIQQCARKLSSTLESAIDEPSVMCAIQLIHVAGRKMEMDGAGSKFLDEWLGRLEAAEPMCSETMRAKVAELMELRNRKWEPLGSQ